MKQLNIIIAGIGGQGINSFVRMLHEKCEQQHWHCISAVYKGGAQRLGSVRAEIKLFSPEYPNVDRKSSQIIPGTLDFLLALEQWESLRYLPYCNEKTQVILDSFIEFPPGTKNIQPKPIPPDEQIKNLLAQVTVEPFREKALAIDGNTRNTLKAMWNEALMNTEFTTLNL